MATKKASSPKKASVKKPVAKAAVVASEATKKAKQITFSEKIVALKPSALIAEFAGTFVLAAIVLNLASVGTIGSVAIALILAILVVVLGSISGAHLNPAISIALWINRKIDGVKACAYIIAQVVGALAAFGLLLGVFNATIEDRVLEATFSSYGITVSEAESQLEASGTTLDEWVEEQGGIDALKEQTGVEFTNAELSDNLELLTGLLELVGAAIFGLGVGYAVFGKGKSQIETGFAVGLSLLAGLIVGGANVILNPAVAAALGAFNWANPFGTDAMTFWWPILVYIIATTIGMTAGVASFKLLQKSVATE